MKSASGKRPPDEAHGPGKDAIRPQQRCLGKSRKEGAHGHAALPAGGGTTLIQKTKPVTRGTAPGWCKYHAAPLRIQTTTPSGVRRSRSASEKVFGKPSFVLRSGGKILEAFRSLSCSRLHVSAVKKTAHSLFQICSKALV